MKSAPVVLALLCSCVIPSVDDDPALAVVEQGLGCPDWMCQTNSPVIDSHGFHELSVRGEANDEGFHITGFYDKFNIPLKPFVSGGQLWGRYAGGTVVGGSQLQGAWFDISYHRQPLYEIRVAWMGETPLWAGGQQQWVPAYLLAWTRKGTGRWTNLCSLPIKDMGMDAYYSVLFEGDRVDAKTKTIDPVSDTRWFNIGCAGSTLAKMYLTGHTFASKAHGYTTTVDQRQTMLKMLSADYCGHGKAFTVAGTPLDWKDDKGWMRYVDPTSTVEAGWTKDGAKCLNKPRIAASQFPDGLAVFPDVATSIAQECAQWGIELEECPEPAGDDDLMGLHLLSANPP